jgi:glycosyltransferase involved in cell wall biosynthesis
MAKFLVINFFPAFAPASSGGELRLGSLYRAVARNHDVTMVTSTDFNVRFEEIQHTSRFRELRFPKDKLWRQAYATLEKMGVYGELSGLAFALAVSDPSCRLRELAWELAPNFDYIVHEFPFSEPIFAGGAPRPEIYNSHNFEASLLPSIVHGHGFDAAFLKLTRLEGNLIARAQHVFATSVADAEKFRLFYGAEQARLSLCPNGFDEAEMTDIAEARYRVTARNARPQLLFTGSAHPPNVDAALFLVEMAGELPHCDIVIAGGVSNVLTDKRTPDNVILFGAFDEAAKKRLLVNADIFVNPVTLGSGTSLKALEALGAQIPMVSTLEGARGLDLVSNVHASLASRQNFAAAIRHLLSDPAHRAAVAAGGRDLALRNFTWAAIAANFSAAIEAGPTKGRPPPPLVLALNDYPINHSNSGGIARIRNLLENCGSDTVLTTFGPGYDFVLIAPNLLLITVPKTAAHQAYETAVNSGQKMSVNDGVAGLFAASNRVLTTIVLAVARRSQAVIFEHPYMAPLLDSIRQTRPDIAVVYSSHNVESRHKAEILREHTAGSILVEFITEIENFLVQSSDMVVCCTEADAEYFAGANVAPIVVPNGCLVPELSDLDSVREHDLHQGPPRIGFLGSSHGPNVAALEFVLRDLVPMFPDVVFEVVGSVCTAVRPPAYANVKLHGPVDEADKTRIMANWTLALNPIESGGGSSLKLPDYMAHGLATINTRAGARGFDVAGHDAGYVAERSQFGDALFEALTDSTRLQRQRHNAYLYAAQDLNWSGCTREYRQRLQSLLGASRTAPSEPERSLLVVTYRYTEPPLGGAEEYLIEVLKQIRPRFGRIDLAAIDVGHITNEHHFSTRVAETGLGATARIGELFDQAVYFPPDPLPSDVIARSRELERAWSREEQTLLAPFAARLRSPSRLRLFGGFFWPENHGGTVRRWTSPAFSFLVPPGAWIFRLTGYASVDKTLRIAVAQVAPDGAFRTLARIEQTVPSWFSTSFTLPATPGDDPVAVLCEVEEHHADGDHRPFGVLLERVSVLQDRAGTAREAGGTIGVLDEVFADLAEENESELRAEAFENWIASLHNMALRHSDQVEADLAAVRGPHSLALQDWLRAAAARYDTVLVQGIPFDVIPRTVETLASLTPRPRVVTLPHFHGDDRFYYWRRYFDSFAAADKTLLFSPAIAASLRLGDKAAIVPGGGVRADEHGDPNALPRFREVYPHTAPFFLILGRKTASKGYRRAVQAQQALRQHGFAVNLVLIGPDEDGQPVDGEGIHYLGRQPREVVRGALLACIGLISMSTSESFGIVLCEAWLFGKPVIANRACYSFRELVREGENGLLVQTNEELADAMRRLVTDEAIRGPMGGSGFLEVQKQFTWAAVAETVMTNL